MPEGDTIARAAARIRPVIEGVIPDAVVAPQPRHRHNGWQERLAGRQVTRVRTHGKHLFIDFERNLTIHSHLRMTGAWSVTNAGSPTRRSSRRAWLVIRCGEQQVTEFDGPVLELLTTSRSRSAQQLARLGPDVLADEFDYATFLRRLREDDPTRGFGDALLDQSTVAGIGNIWKAESCWTAQIDPWRSVANVTDDQAIEAISLVRPLMFESAAGHERSLTRGAYGRTGRECGRCGSKIKAKGQGTNNRTTYWCPGCQR